MVLVFGTICIDRIRRVSTLPKPGGYCPVLSQIELLGGEAANTACFLVMWRQEVVLAGNGLGFGLDYENIRLKLLEKGLDVTFLVRSEATPECDVYVSEDGDRTMFGFGFDSAIHTPLEKLPWLKDHWFTADPNLSVGGRAAMRRAHEKGMRLYLMDFFREDEFIPEGAVCQYSTDWVGQRSDNEQNRKWVESWSKKHLCYTILTDAADGTHFCTPQGEYHRFPVFKVEEVLDTTGAGDAFRAGTIHGLSQGWDFGRAIQFGSAAGALKVPHIGATEYLPSVFEVEKVIESQPQISAQFDLPVYVARP